MSGKDFNGSPRRGTTPDPSASRRLYPVEAAAFELGISERKTWTLIDSGRLKTVWLDGRRLVPADALDEFVANLPTIKPETVAA